MSGAAGRNDSPFSAHRRRGAVKVLRRALAKQSSENVAEIVAMNSLNLRERIPTHAVPGQPTGLLGSHPEAVQVQRMRVNEQHDSISQASTGQELATKHGRSNTGSPTVQVAEFGPQGETHDGRGA